MAYTSFPSFIEPFQLQGCSVRPLSNCLLGGAFIPSSEFASLRLRSRQCWLIIFLVCVKNYPLYRITALPFLPFFDTFPLPTCIVAPFPLLASFLRLLSPQNVEREIKSARWRVASIIPKCHVPLTRSASVALGCS